MKIFNIAITLASIIFISLIMSACNNEVPTSNTAVKEAPKVNKLSRVEQAISEAISTKDYRLYGLAGRRIILPGLESENIKDIKKRCGVRLLSGTGDVLKNSQDRESRRENYQFAAKINKKLYVLCLKNSQG